MRYWTHLFTGLTWQQFLDAGADVIAYPQRQWNVMQEMRSGDVILCHLLDSKSFIGILSVVDAAYMDTALVWNGGENMPVRLPVRITAEVDFENRVPIDAIRHRLTFYADADPLDAWDNHFNNPPISEVISDARVVIKAIGYNLKTRQPGGMSEEVINQLTQTQEVLRVIHQQLSTDETSLAVQNTPAGGARQSAGTRLADDDEGLPPPASADIQDDDDLPAEEVSTLPMNPYRAVDDLPSIPTSPQVHGESAPLETQPMNSSERPNPPNRAQDVPAKRATGEIQVAVTHLDIQVYLYEIAHKLGLQVWVPQRDLQRTVNGQPFSQAEGVVSTMPAMADSRAQELFAAMDLVWIQNDAVVASFEIEADTDVESGLLRMNDLKLILPEHSRIRLYLVAPVNMRERLRKALSRPSFATSPANLVDSCRMIPFSALRAKIEQVDSLGVLRYLQPEFLDEISTSLKV